MKGFCSVPSVSGYLRVWMLEIRLIRCQEGHSSTLCGEAVQNEPCSFFFPRSVTTYSNWKVRRVAVHRIVGCKNSHPETKMIAVLIQLALACGYISRSANAHSVLRDLRCSFLGLGLSVLMWSTPSTVCSKNSRLERFCVQIFINLNPSMWSDFRICDWIDFFIF